MIHSLCGGSLKDNGIFTVVKVKFENNPLCLDRPYFYICKVVGIKAGDKVLAPFGRDKNLFTASVIRVDENINEQVLPMPLSHMMTIEKKL